MGYRASRTTAPTGPIRLRICRCGRSPLATPTAMVSAQPSSPSTTTTRAGWADILRYITVFNITPPSPPSADNARFDLNANNKIGLSDILMFISFFNLTCTP